MAVFLRAKASKRGAAVVERQTIVHNFLPENKILTNCWEFAQVSCLLFNIRASAARATCDAVDPL
jgi:hypothetical protein